MYYGYSMHLQDKQSNGARAFGRKLMIELKIARNPTRIKVTPFDPRHTLRFPRWDKGKKGERSALCICIFTLPRYTITMRCDGDTVASAPRATMQSVRTTGNNWTIYEPRGLALRMYDYRGKRCVAHTLWTSLWRTSWPHHHHPFPPSLPSTACNYSRGHCISIPRLIVKIRAGNSAEGQYRRGQRSFCAPSTRSREPVVLQGYLYKTSRNRRFMLLYSLKSAYLRVIARV